MLAFVSHSAVAYQATGLKSSAGRSGVVMQVGQPLEPLSRLLEGQSAGARRLHAGALSSNLAGEVQGDSLPERGPGA